MMVMTDKTSNFKLLQFEATLHIVVVYEVSSEATERKEVFK